MQNKPCPPGKSRNPATGRCRKVVENKVAVNKAKPACKPGKVRDPKTGRCRKPRPGNKAVSPVKAKIPSPYGRTIKEKCKATPLNKCEFPCSAIMLPNGKLICTQVKRRAKMPSKQAMRTMAAWA